MINQDFSANNINNHLYINTWLSLVTTMNIYFKLMDVYRYYAQRNDKNLIYCYVDIDPLMGGHPRPFHDLIHTSRPLWVLSQHRLGPRCHGMPNQIVTKNI